MNRHRGRSGTGYRCHQVGIGRARRCINSGLLADVIADLTGNDVGTPRELIPIGIDRRGPCRRVNILQVEYGAFWNGSYFRVDQYDLRLAARREWFGIRRG
jgi:hypothetical protein